jgi:diguanylate cyclase (GGDEF)-like protein/PAS domain S-box-containing protein
MDIDAPASTRQKPSLTAHPGEEFFRSLFENAAAGMAVATIDGTLLQVNPAFCTLLGYPPGELLRLKVSEITHPDDRERTRDNFQAVAEGKTTVFHYEKRYLRRDGAVVWGLTTVAWLLDEAGRPTWCVALIQDITDRKKAEEALRQSKSDLIARQKDLDYLSYHDPLTGLPNRLLLQDRLQHALAKARRAGSEAALLFLDLDRFKNINDTLGHEVGDRILCEVAKRLRGLVRETDTLARFVGDEFIVLLEDLAEPKIAVRIARQIVDALAAPIEVEHERFHLGGSIGISLFPHNGEDAESLLKCGEVAMYQAKEKGRNTCQFYTPDMNARTRELMLLENSLRQALAREQFVLHFQPQVDIETGRVLGVEALVRWNHPDLGMIPPEDFIPLAEETGLIVPMGEWILRTACAQARTWRLARLPALRVAVNISPRQFRFPQLADRIRGILAETEMAPGLLELELTESMVMHDVETAIRTMNELTALGIQLAIDDFGTGYSSLHHLRRFPIRRLKIDRDFVRDVNANANDAAIASAIIALARTMTLEVVAEGIETREQLAFLKAKECQIGQGYLFSRPLPAEELGCILRLGKVSVD